MARRAAWDVKAGRRLWAEGWSANFIAATLNASVCTVLAYASQHEWPRRAVTRRPTDADKASVAAKYAPATVPPISNAVTLYRAEKAARTYLGPADEFAEIKLHLMQLEESSKPKRGRPKQSIGRPAQQEAA